MEALVRLTVRRRGVSPNAQGEAERTQSLVGRFVKLLFFFCLGSQGRVTRRERRGLFEGVFEK